MTEERFKHLMREKWLSYNDGIEMPEYQDNGSKFMLSIIEEEFEKYFKQIHDIIEEAYNELNLTPEQREFFNNKWKFKFELTEDGKCLFNICTEDNT